MDANPSFFKKEYTPFLFQWDQTFIKNYSFYKQKVENLKKSYFYEIFPQRSRLKLNIYKKMKYIGEVFPLEFEIYKNIDCNVIYNYNRTFKYFHYDYKYIFIPASIFLIYSMMNNYNKRIIIFGSLFLIFASFALNEFDLEPNLYTLDFLNWVFEFRKAKG